MVFEKVGINFSGLQNLTPPNMSQFNISSNPTEIINEIPAKANAVTQNYYGLGIMVVLFFYLVYKLGELLELGGQQYSYLRTVGISAGVVSILGYQMLLIGYFTEIYHVVIFITILLICFIWVYLEER